MNPLAAEPVRAIHELGMLTMFAGDLPVHPVALDDRYALDWVMKTNQEEPLLSAWVACVHGMRPRSGMVILSLKKWKDGVRLNMLGGKPFYVVAEWEGEIFFVRHDEVLASVIYGLGSRAGDPEDIPCVQIPSHLFKSRSAANP